MVALNTRRQVNGSSDSQYEYDPDWDEEEEDEDEEGSEPLNSVEPQDGVDDLLSEPNLSRSSVSSQDDLEHFIAAADDAIKRLEDLHTSTKTAWKKALTHKSGVIVYTTKEKLRAETNDKGKAYYAPVFKGEHIIKRFSPAAIFGVVGTRKLWDDWYKEGNLVQNLTDSSSLTYMCMKGIAGSSTRDLSLAEKVSGSPTGSISFASTSVVTSRIPRVSGRVRASIFLNGWVLEHVAGGTRVTYYLHVNVNTFIPSFAAAKYLARRPTCIAKIDDYLQSHGPPPVAVIDTPPSSPRSPSQSRSSRRASTWSKASTRSTNITTPSTSEKTLSPTRLPTHVELETDAATRPELDTAQTLFKSLLSLSSDDWRCVVDHKENKIMLKTREGSSFPIAKGEAKIRGVTTEQVLGALLSCGARRKWDMRYDRREAVILDNGFDQGVYIEVHKGILPSLPPRQYTIAHAVFRHDASSDNDEILLLSCSTKTRSDAHSEITKAQLDVSGWLLRDEEGCVHITHIAQTDPLADPPLPPAVQRILVAEIGRSPVELVNFLDAHGHPPFFLRWGDGPAHLRGELLHESDLLEGKVVFDVAGDGATNKIQQKCWLQWSEKMYERGINIKVTPKNVVKMSRLDGEGRIVEFIWSDSVKSEGAKITLTRGEGGGAEDVFVDGKFLDEVVTVEKHASPSKSKSRRRLSSVVPSDIRHKNPSTSKDKRPEKKKSSQIPDAPTPIGLAATTSQVVDAVTSGTRSIALPVKKAVQPQSIHEEVKIQHKTPFPDDACLIVTQELYFTRKQCLFVVGALVVGYLWGRVR